MAETKRKKEEMTEQEKREKMLEVQTGKRIFETDKYGLVQIRFPKVEENRMADWEYSKVFFQARKDGIPTKREMEEMIKKYNLWTQADEEKIEKIREEINKQLVILSKMETEKNIRPVEEKIERLREELFALQQEKQKYFENTAESKADEAKLSYLIWRCTEYADTGKRIWETYEDFKNEDDQITVNQIVYQFLTFINGLPAEFLYTPAEEEGETEEQGADSE